MTLSIAPSKRGEPEDASREALFPLALKPILVISGMVGAVLLVVSPRYGYNGDELYFVAAGHHLSWGYADQPPLIPLLAAILDTLFPGSLVALRIPPMLTTSAGVLVVALIARELRGDRRAQILAAAAWAVTVQFINSGHMLATWAIDPFLWTVISWLVVRWTRLNAQGLRADHLLLWASAVTAVALQVKLLIPVFWFCLGISVLAVGPRELLRRPMLWWGAAVTVLTLIPTLLWQHANGWPQLRMPEAVAGENWYGWLYLPLAIASAGLVGAVGVCYGCWRLLRSPSLRPYRFLGWTAVGTVVVFMVADGRPYYVAGMFGLLYAVAAVEWRFRAPRITVSTYAVSACMALITLPVLPISAIPWFDGFGRGSLGWPQLTSTVADAYHRVAPHGRTAIITHDYWSASALHHYGPATGIPEASSGSRGFWYLNQPPQDTQQVVYLGGTREYLLRFFQHVEPLATVDTDVPTFYEGTVIWVATQPRQPWPRLWPQFKRMGLFDGTTGSATEIPGTPASQ